MSRADNLLKLFEECMPEKNSSGMYEVKLESTSIDDLKRQRARLDEKIVGSVGNLKMLIKPNDHVPPHFQVDCNGEGNSFRIDNGEPLHRNGLNKFFPVIKKWHAENRDELIRISNEFKPMG